MWTSWIPPFLRTCPLSRVKHSVSRTGSASILGLKISLTPVSFGPIGKVVLSVWAGFVQALRTALHSCTCGPVRSNRSLQDLYNLKANFSVLCVFRNAKDVPWTCLIFKLWYAQYSWNVRKSLQTSPFTDSNKLLFDLQVLTDFCLFYIS